MAFIDIKNPLERDKIVKEYIETVKQIKDKTLDDKAQGLQRKRQIEEVFSPVVGATNESTNKITDEIKKNRAVNESTKGYWQKGFTQTAVEYYLNLKSNKDTYYGIQKEGSNYVMGDKIVTVDEQSNIQIDGTSFQATPGLWELIMLKIPQNYTQEDMQTYEDLVYKTDVIANPLIKKSTDKPKLTVKYTKLLKYLEPEEVSEEEQEAPKKRKVIGEGIQFLPGNISGLLDRLKLVYGEREAGNIKSTNNEIVGILDELLRLKYLSRGQYNMVSRSLCL